MAAFHLFPRLPIDLRIQIWELATEERVVRIRRLPSQGYGSPTPVPAITRVNRESRDFCSYRKAFMIENSPCYIWVDFDHDIIQISSRLAVAEDFPERDAIKHIRFDLTSDWEEAHVFYHHNASKVRNFQKLEKVDILVRDGIRNWTDFVTEIRWRWGDVKMRNVRVVDAGTGEWIDGEMCDAYQDYVDTDGGENLDSYTRDPMANGMGWENEGEKLEYEVERVAAMKRLQMPRPRINMDYMDY